MKETGVKCFSKLGNIFFCCKKKKEITLSDNKGNIHTAIIKQAPEPEDVFWDNLGQSTKRKVLVKLMSFLITATILVMSYFVVFGLSKWQINR